MAPWKIRHGDEEVEVPSLEALRAKAKSGELKQDHYVFNPILKQWIYAKDVAELAECYRGERANHLNKVAWMFFAFAALFAVLGMGLLSSIAFVAAIGCAVAYYFVGGHLSGVTKAVLMIPVVLVGLVVLLVILAFGFGFGASLFSRSKAPAKPPATKSAPPEAVAPVREAAEKPVIREEPTPKPGGVHAIRTEYVYADATTRTFHRRKCPERTTAHVKVYREVAEEHGYSPHSVCVNFEPEVAFRFE